MAPAEMAPAEMEPAEMGPEDLEEKVDKGGPLEMAGGKKKIISKKGQYRQWRAIKKSK